MKNNLPVLVLDQAYILPSLELRMDFDSSVDKRIFSIAEGYHNSNLIIINHKLNKKKIDIDKLPRIGVQAAIKLHMDLPNGKTKIVIEGIRRVKITSYVNGDIIEANYEELEDLEDAKEKEAYLRVLYNHIERYMNFSDLSEDFLNTALSIETLEDFINFVVGNLPIPNESKMKYVKEESNLERAEMLLNDIEKDIEVAEVMRNIDDRLSLELDKSQKEYILREKIRVIKEELGDMNNDVSIVSSRISKDGSSGEEIYIGEY